MNKPARIRFGTLLTAAAASLVLIAGGLTFDRQQQPFTTPSAIAQSPSTTSAQAIDSAAALSALADDLQSLVTLGDEVKANKVGIVVRSLKSDRLVYALNGDTPLTPASTTKVVTCFTALSDLGPDYQVTTDAALANKPKDGVLVGDLYIRGHGDPNLTLSDLDVLAEKIVATGIRQINGNIVGDGSFFDDKYVRTE